MVDTRDDDPHLEDDYDEDADSDFDAGNINDEPVSESSDEEPEDFAGAIPQPKKRRKVDNLTKSESEVDEQASGDEEIIGEQRRVEERRRQKQKRKGKVPAGEGQSDEEEPGWRARTRAMRERDKTEKKKSKLATTKGSTIDVEKIWEEMNRPAWAKRNDVPASNPTVDPEMIPLLPQKDVPKISNEKEITSEQNAEELVTIQESYVFAGKSFTREVKVPKSSINEPRVISKESSHVLLVAVKGKVIRRPLRRISRFDPNANNDAFKKTWKTSHKPKKVTVLTKTAGDWEEHVEAMGDREELDEHAKSKGGYLGRQDFLQSVEQRKEEEARQARLRR